MTPELEARIKEAHAVATEQLNMDPGDVRFIMVPAHIMYATASQGLPGMWSHWSDGRDYWRYKKMHDSAMQTIYEMVTNTRPFLALLLDSNSDITNLMVAAHVFGHTHLDLHNAAFKDTNPHILEVVNTWARQIEAYEEEHGDLVVEQFIDKVLSLEPYASATYKGKLFKQEKPEKIPLAELLPAPPPVKVKKVFQPVDDLFGFIGQYAEGLEDWQRDILDIYRRLTLYFQPQGRTKVIHEGFASLCHRRIMERMDIDGAEWLEYAKLTSGVMSPSPGSLNPYWLGHAILEDIEEREGWDAVLEAVAVEDNSSLIRNHLTEKLCEKLELFSFRFFDSDKTWAVDDEPRDWETIRDALVTKMEYTPTIEVTEYDHDGKRGLMLQHRFDGRRLDMLQAEQALVAIADLWGQRVHLRTQRYFKKDENYVEVEGTAWAPNERDSVPDGVATPVDWEIVQQ